MRSKTGKGKFVLALVVILLLFLVVYYFRINRVRAKEDTVVLSETQSAIQRDLSANYPQTPKAVVRYYAELSKCMYNPDNTDKEVEELAAQSRRLLDESLVARQSDIEYLASLRSTIAGFIQDKRKIISYTTSSSSEVVYATTDLGDTASLYCNFTMQKDSLNYIDSEQFLLRKDKDGHWKIVGWQSANQNKTES
ncbi:hypothetical protein SAMN06296386_107146 [Lachnospiraceae bacterium]|nr:hypothetical protein SAMN06296386_107146 [Lachnospiraceae bacterium]